MANKKISDLTAAASLGDTDIYEVSSGATASKKTTWALIKSTLKTYFDSLTTTLTNKTINTASNTITVVEADISDLGSYITASSTDTLTNKTIDADNNTLSNIVIGTECTGASTALTDTTDITYNADTDVSGNAWTIDEDDMSSDLATKVPSQQSVKAYVDAQPEAIGVAASDETTDLTTGTAKVTFRMPFAMTLTDVRANVNTAPVGATVTVDINEDGTTILSTKITIDASEKTSETAATAPVISDSALTDDSEITIDIDQIGSSTAGKGLKVWLIGTRS